MTKILDTNILVRYLTGDNKKQQTQAKKWFRQAQDGELSLIIKPLVVAEACFVIESFYKQTRSNIANSFLVLLAQKWLIVEDRDVLLELWPWYTKNFHFVDSYLLAWKQKNGSDILSFDNKLNAAQKKYHIEPN